MKTIGLIGGMSWESSSVYYRVINETIQARLGGLHSAQSLLYTVDFDPIARMQQQGRWQEAGAILANAAQCLERGGAEFIILCTNTMHTVADTITAHVRIPLLHIAEPTAQAIQHCGFSRVGLLGTRFTMEQDFYIKYLQNIYNLDVIVPNEADRTVVHEIIYNELCRGTIRPESKQQYLDIIERMITIGAQAIILGCTEIGLLIEDNDSSVPFFDTTILHAVAAVDYALVE